MDLVFGADVGLTLIVGLDDFVGLDEGMALIVGLDVPLPLPLLLLFLSDLPLLSDFRDLAFAP